MIQAFLSIFLSFWALDSDPIPFLIPTIELDNRTDLQTIVDQEDGVYLGHPSTVLLEDGKTILIVYPKGHGKGEIIYKRSEDGGKIWSDRLQVPHNWASSKEVPTIHRVVDGNGKEIFTHAVNEGDIWRMAQTKDAPIKDWVRLAVSRARATGSPAVFWLDANRAHDASLMSLVDKYLPEHDTSGLDIHETFLIIILLQIHLHFLNKKCTIIF